MVAAEGAESEQLLAWHPWSGARIDLSLSQYADDTTKKIVAEQGEDVGGTGEAGAMHQWRVRWCAGVRWVFCRTGGKEELLMHLVGAGSLADRRRVREGQVQVPGKVGTVARHICPATWVKRLPLFMSFPGAPGHDDGILFGGTAVVCQGYDSCWFQTSPFPFPCVPQLFVQLRVDGS